MSRSRGAVLINQLRSVVRRGLAVFAAWGVEPGCAVSTPTWLHPATWLLFGAAEGAVAAAVAGAPALHWPVIGALGSPLVQYPLLGVVAGLVVVVVLGRVCEAWHGHCVVCGRCSAAAGVPTCRTRRGADAALVAAGWLVGVDGDYCPDDNPFEVTS